MSAEEVVKQKYRISAVPSDVVVLVPEFAFDDRHVHPLPIFESSAQHSTALLARHMRLVISWIARALTISEYGKVFAKKPMKRVEQLRETLRRIDRKGYKAYRDIQGEFQFDDCVLAIDHVQADPFAAPSRMRLVFPRKKLNLPETNSKLNRIALEDYLARRFRSGISATATDRQGSGKSGSVQIDAGNQEVLERTACQIADDRMEIRISVGLPAQGRPILGGAASRLLIENLSELARKALILDESLINEATSFIETIEDADALREQLGDHGLVAFIADGAILPRQSGISDRPMSGDVVPFHSADRLRVELNRPHGGPISGMGIPEGVSLIVGGGFHGKSTLLEALSRGIYNHIPGDGREFVVTRNDAVNIRAEDGRSVTGNDLRPFIGKLPLGKETDDFSTENASGSTSQAANILEAIESGSRLLLMDEDTCATNFMIRDEMMRKLVPDDSEPITPFIDQVRQLHDHLGVSTVLVMGGAGDYFGVADTVIWMDEYRPVDVTEKATELIVPRQSRTGPFPPPVERIPVPESIDPTRGNRTKTRARGTEEIGFGTENIDLRQVEQIVDASQTRGIAEILVFARKEGVIDGKKSVSEILDAIDRLLEKKPIDSVSNFNGHPGDFARPRRFEIAAALNRLRSLNISHKPR
jgi:predicted ABC-class ATPase